ncbi:MAG TPA: FAD-dependent oxidoreductase [Roseiflexaceae bacterium]|nr:FAD-dependent oxidoreductase [Roseiflexaceae bacterium]
MDLKSGTPFWPIRNGLIAAYPALKEDIRCDVAIIGGGISSALVAYHLAEAGVDTVAIEQRDIAYGSTSASTSLLQYEVDTHLYELIDMIGEHDAVRSYQVCLEALVKLERLIGKLDNDCDYERKNSLYIASRRRDASSIKKEYEARRKYGFNLDLLDKRDIAERFSFSAPAALLSYNAAQVDVYKLTHALFRAATGMGARIFDRTEMTRWEHVDGGVALITDRGCRITARKIVFATGYESQRYIKRKVGQLKNTYALASEPLEEFTGWQDGCLIWETARPYFYMRTTADGRAIIGGEDDTFNSPVKRDASVTRKSEKLAKKFRSMFPEIDLEVAYAWGGTFGETKDGLAYIGAVDEFPDAFFVFGYGGNGVTYSMIAGELVRDLFLERPNPDTALFRFDR